jgi:hypothetical protein
MAELPRMFSEMTNSLVILAEGMKHELTIPDAVVWLAGRDEPLFHADLMRFAEHSWEYLESNKVVRASYVSFRSHCSRTNAKFWTLEMEDDDHGRKRVVLSDEGIALLSKLREAIDQEYNTVSLEEWGDSVFSETLRCDESELNSTMIIDESGLQIDKEVGGTRPKVEALASTPPGCKSGKQAIGTETVRPALFSHLVETRKYLHCDMIVPVDKRSKNTYINYYHPNSTIRMISPYMQVIARAIEYSAREASSIQTQEAAIRKNGPFMMSDSIILEAMSQHFKCSGDELMEKMKLYEEIGTSLDAVTNTPLYLKYVGRIRDELDVVQKLLEDTLSKPSSPVQTLTHMQQFMRNMSDVRARVDACVHAVVTDQVLNCMKVENETSVKLFERLVQFVDTYEDE